jgi:hypothetical protein
MRTESEFIQLAGGTNEHSAAFAAEASLTARPGFGGFAFGGYARKMPSGLLRALEESEVLLCEFLSVIFIFFPSLCSFLLLLLLLFFLIVVVI